MHPEGSVTRIYHWILSWDRWIQSTSSDMNKIYFNIILCSGSRSAKWSLLSGFQTKLLYIFSSYLSYIIHPHHFPWIIKSKLVQLQICIFHCSSSDSIFGILGISGQLCKGTVYVSEMGHPWSGCLLPVIRSSWKTFWAVGKCGLLWAILAAGIFTCSNLS